MSGSLFRRLVRASAGDANPGFKRATARIGYDILSVLWRDSGWRFMNYGYLPAEAAPPDEVDAPFIGLYRAALGSLPLQGARVLEVGSGRGGGAAWMARQPGIAAVTGVDLSPLTVARARRLNPGVAGLDFRRGDAEALPFPDASFDGVVNVESSHNYGSMPRFLAEVARVLRPGGWFAWADMRPASALPQLDRDFAASRLVIESEAELTDGVLRALDHMEATKRGSIARFRPFAPMLNEFAAMDGSMIRRGLQRGGIRYLARRCRKPITPAAT